MTDKQQAPHRKYKIAYSISFFPALSETYLLNQLAALLDDGHDITIFSIGKPIPFTKHEIIERYNLFSRTVYRPSIPRGKVHRVLKALQLLIKHSKDFSILIRTLNVFKFGKYALDLQFFFDTIPFLKFKEFDIVHCHFGPNGIKAVNFREIGLLKGKLITSLHGYDVNKKDFLEWRSHYGRKGLYKDLVKACKLFTVNSSFIRKKAVALGIPEHKIALLPVGTNTAIFKKPKNTANSQTAPILLTVARLVEWKGLEYSIRAIADLVTEFPNLHYHILGEGEQRDELEDLIIQLGLAEHVTLHGAATHETVWHYYTKAQIFVLSGIVGPDQEVEAQGMVLQEAQSMELPVITSDAGGAPEGMIDNITGYVVPPKDIAALTNKIRILLQNPELRLSMGRAGRQFVQKNFDVQVLHRKLIKLYDSVM